MELCYANNPDSLFRKYAKLITWFSNTQLGRDYLSIPKSLGHIVKLSPNSFHEYLGQPKKNTIAIQGRFYTFNRYYEKLGLALETIDMAQKHITDFHHAKEALTYYLGLRHAYGLPRLLYTVATFNPNTGEGRVDRGNDVSWAACRDAATGNSTAANPMIYIDDAYYQSRAFLPFDTSSIGTNSVVSSGVNKVKVYRDDSLLAFSNGRTLTAHWIQTSQASGTALATSDYSLVTFTSGGSFTLASTSNGAYSEVTLNSTGDGWINTTGYTKLGLINHLDLNNTAPGVGSYDACAFQKHGDANPPVLTITYTTVTTNYLTSRARKRIKLSGVSAG